MINRFIFGHGVVIYFMMQSLLEIRSKNLLFFLLSKRVGSLPSCLFCQQPQRFLRKQIVWNLLFVDTFYCKNWTEIVLLFVYVTLFQHCTRWHHVTFFCWCSWHFRSECVQWKSKCSLYLVSWDVLYICHTNKRHIYATPLRSKYFVRLHYKYL